MSDLSEKRMYDASVSVKPLKDVPKLFTINFWYEFNFDTWLHSKALEVFEKAGENDEIVIYFNSPGGSVNTLIMFKNALLRSKCKNITAKINYAASAAAILALYCPNIEFNIGSTLMFHTFSTYMYGKGQEVTSALDHIKDIYYRMIRNICRRIMSPEEIERMIKGEDFHFSEVEALERLKKYTKVLEDEEKKKEAKNKVKKNVNRK